MNKLNLKIISSIFVGVLLTGCTVLNSDVEKDDPYWAPAYPTIVDTSQSNPGAIYNPVSAKMLFQDRKALNVGDIITVILSESTNATKNADTELSKDTTLSMAAPNLLGNGLNGVNPISVGGGTTDLSVGYTGANAFKAETDSKQSNNLTGTISVTVHQIYPNGNLLVKGEKWISLNQGSEFIRVAGIVRPEDISKDNQVISNRIANARISYGGKGPLAEKNEEGWLSRFFNSSWWPL